MYHFGDSLRKIIMAVEEIIVALKTFRQLLFLVSTDRLARKNHPKAAATG